MRYRTILTAVVSAVALGIVPTALADGHPPPGASRDGARIAEKSKKDNHGQSVRQCARNKQHADDEKNHGQAVRACAHAKREPPLAACKKLRKRLDASRDSLRARVRHGLEAIAKLPPEQRAAAKEHLRDEIHAAQDRLKTELEKAKDRCHRQRERGAEPAG